MNANISRRVPILHVVCPGLMLNVDRNALRGLQYRSLNAAVHRMPGTGGCAGSNPAPGYFFLVQLQGYYIWTEQFYTVAFSGSCEYSGYGTDLRACVCVRVCG